MIEDKDEQLRLAISFCEGFFQSKPAPNDCVATQCLCTLFLEFAEKYKQNCLLCKKSFYTFYDDLLACKKCEPEYEKQWLKQNGVNSFDELKNNPIKIFNPEIQK